MQLLSTLLPTFPRKPVIDMTKKQGTDARARVTLYYLTPLMAWLRDKLALLGTVSALVGSIVYAINTGLETSEDWFPILLLPTLTYWPLLIGFEHLLTRCKMITFDQTKIKYRRYLLPKSFDRDLPHQFVLTPHPLGSVEKNWIDTRVRRDRTKQKAKFRKPYFQQGYTLCLVSAEISHEIVTIFDERRAQRCLSYLNSAEARLDGMAGFGKGFATEVNDEWRTQPGDLPR